MVDGRKSYHLYSRGPRETFIIVVIRVNIRKGVLGRHGHLVTMAAEGCLRCWPRCSDRESEGNAGRAYTEDIDVLQRPSLLAILNYEVLSAVSSLTPPSSRSLHSSSSTSSISSLPPSSSASISVSAPSSSSPSSTMYIASSSSL